MGAKTTRKSIPRRRKEKVEPAVVEHSDSSSSSEDEFHDAVMSIDEAERAAAENEDSESDQDGESEEEEEEAEESDSEESGSEESDKEKSESVESEGEESDSEESEDEDASMETNETSVTNSKAVVTPTHLDDENCTFDLRNLLVMNGHQMDITQLYQSQSNSKQEEEKDCCIPLTDLKIIPANEDFLLQKASEGCQKLIAELWSLPTEKTNVGPLASLPHNFVVALPRQLPPPAQKAGTKWEEFAKERGIVPKSKRSRKVHDEATDSWTYLTGAHKAKNAADNWPIMEVKKNDDPYADPWEKQRDLKRAKLDKHMENTLRNQERAGLLKKGTTTRVMKDKKAAVEKGKEGHKKGNANIPSGVPVDLRPGKLSQSVQTHKRGKDLTQKALLSTQRSTASLGKFDEMRVGEPERKNAIRKRKFDTNISKDGVASESDRGLKVLDRVMSGGRQKDLDIRKGKYATGETAYDYEYSDGLGPSSFRKKKGRAGAGKMKKVTKKRAK